jgi:hypothetical protein
MPTLLTYDYATSKFLLQVSPDTGNLLRANLTIVATNPGPDQVWLQGIKVTLPQGTPALNPARTKEEDLPCRKPCSVR